MFNQIIKVNADYMLETRLEIGKNLISILRGLVMEVNKVINGECLEVVKTIPDKKKPSVISNPANPPRRAVKKPCMSPPYTRQRTMPMRLVWIRTI